MLQLSEIRSQFYNYGINPPNEIIPDGNIHRFKIDDKDKKKSGWYRCYRNMTRKGDEFFVCVLGDNHSPDEVHIAKTNVKLEKHDKASVEEQIRKAQRAAHNQKLELQRAAANDASERWEKLTDQFGKNEYLEKKGLKELFGARISGFDLLIPMRNIDGELKNLETVYGPGQMKKGLYGGERTGLFHQIGELREVVYICEGFSTAASINAATGGCAIATFNCGNLVPVATAIRTKYPTIKIVVCADNDQFENSKGEINNVGFDKATEAANSVGAKVIVPRFKDLDSKPTDFNDLFLLEGADAVKNQIRDIKPLAAPEKYDPAYVINAPYPDQNLTNGNKKGTIENVQEMLRRLGVTVRYNLITKEEETLIPDGIFSMDNRANATLAELTSWCERVGIPHANLSGILTTLADRNPYNPVVTWVQSSPWDGECRLEKFYQTVTAANEAENISILCMKECLIRKWMLSAVAGAFNPHGVSAGGILVFQGAQYLGKTAWFKSLVPASLGIISDGMFLRPEDKDSVFQAVSQWLVELGELDATFRKSDIAQLKAFITKDKDVLRRPYAKKESSFSRRTVFFGSVNELDFLKDPTGNRRFWTIECEKLNWDHGLDMQQVWAELYERYYLKGASWHLTAGENDELNIHNENFRAVEPIEEMIRLRFPWESNGVRLKMTASDVLKEIGFDRPSPVESRSAGAVLRKLTTSLPMSKGVVRFLVPDRNRHG